MTETKFGTFEELLDGHADHVVEIARNLRRIVLDMHPEAVEVTRLGDGASTYGLGPKKMSEAYCYIMPLKERVNFGFFYGAVLADELGLMEGTGKMLRHVKIRTLEASNSKALETLLKDSFVERLKALDRD